MVVLKIDELKADIELIKLAIKLEDDCCTRRCLSEELLTAQENLEIIYSNTSILK